MASLLRLPYPLLISLVLLLSACKKSDPAPEPTLKGYWDLTSYSANRTQLTQATVTFPVGNNAGARYYTFTDTTMQVFASVGGASASPQPYTKAGNVLTFYINQPSRSNPTPLGTSTITQLTDKSLTLFSTQDSSVPPYGYSTYENHFTRR
jgi:hypothetical protein